MDSPYKNEHVIHLVSMCNFALSLCLRGNSSALFPGIVGSHQGIVFFLVGTNLDEQVANAMGLWVWCFTDPNALTVVHCSSYAKCLAMDDGHCLLGYADPP